MTSLKIWKNFTKKEESSCVDVEIILNIIELNLIVMTTYLNFHFKLSLQLNLITNFASFENENKNIQIIKFNATLNLNNSTLLSSFNFIFII